MVTLMQNKMPVVPYEATCACVIATIQPLCVR